MFAMNDKYGLTSGARRLPRLFTICTYGSFSVWIHSWLCDGTTIGAPQTLTLPFRPFYSG